MCPQRLQALQYRRTVFGRLNPPERRDSCICDTCSVFRYRGRAKPTASAVASGDRATLGKSDSPPPALTWRQDRSFRRDLVRTPYMSEKKIIAVVGATGAQGGGLVRAILADRAGQFVARAVTRKTDSEKARALATAGAEVVTADADDQASLERAFSGAHGA